MADESSETTDPRVSGNRSGPTAAGRPRLVVLSGPSGVGKSSVLAQVRARLPQLFISISVTTRAPRPGEIDGLHYRFVDDAQFDDLLSAGQLLEHAEYAGNRYGTPRAPVERALAAGWPALLEIEVRGARQVRAAMPDALLVMLIPPTWSDLVNRLTMRGTESVDVLDRRLAMAREELSAAGEYDLTVVNDNVQEAAERLVALLTGH